ncbi:hypothetical protein RSK20926_14309 [Roseobacter sp. SK209-2-6]|nr:hypothetical protein RSK20926_14309 [Roseobacter sp. SK209-2-6]
MQRTHQMNAAILLSGDPVVAGSIGLLCKSCLRALNLLFWCQMAGIFAVALCCRRNRNESEKGEQEKQ